MTDYSDRWNGVNHKEEPISAEEEARYQLKCLVFERQKAPVEAHNG